MIKSWLLFICISLLAFPSFSQKPDLNKYPTPKEKLSVLSKYIQSCGRQEKYDEAIDALKTGIVIAKKYKIDSTLLEYYYFTGAAYETSHADSALVYLKKAEDLAFKIHHTKYLVRSQFELLNVYHTQNRTDSISSIMQKLQSESTKLDSLSWEKATLLNNIGYAYYRQLKYNESLTYFFRALDIYQHLKDSSDVAILWHILGNAYRKLNLYPKSVFYYRQARELYLAMGTVLRAAECADDLGSAYAEMGMPDSALIYHKMALETAKKYKAVETIAYATLHLGQTYSKLGQLSLATSYLTEALKIAQQNNYEAVQIDAFMELGNINFKLKSFEKAKNFYEQSHKLALRNERKALLVETYLKLAETEAALNNYDKAYGYQKTYIAYKDSINAEISNKNIAEMEAKYQNEKKMQEISLLAEKNKLQTLKLKNQRLNLYFLLAGLFSILLFSIVLWRNFKLKQKSNLLLEAKNIELVAASEKISAINEKLSEANQSKTKLFGIISHDLRTPVIGLIQFLRMQDKQADSMSEDYRKKQSLVIEQSAENLVNVMEDMLIWAKSQMENFELSIEPVDIRSLIDEVIMVHKINAEQKNVSLQIDCPEDQIINTDSNFLRIIIRNLLSNAIKFSPDGEAVDIQVTMADEALSIKSRNQGKSMSREQIEDLNNWQSIKSSPSGMGLKLTKEFLVKLQGTLEVNPGTMNGNEFIVTLYSLR